MLALPQSIDFKPAWHLWLIKRSSARPGKIVLPSLIVSVAFLFIHTGPECLKNHVCPHTIFTICHPSYPSIWAYVTHVTLDTRLPLFSHVCWKIGEPGDEASSVVWTTGMLNVWKIEQGSSIIIIFLCWILEEVLYSCLIIHNYSRYGFKGPPNLTLVAKPRLGNREVKLSRVTHWIERKLQELVNVSDLHWYIV